MTSVEVEEKGEGEREVYEEEIEESDSEQQKLKTIINSTLTSHFKQLKVILITSSLHHTLTILYYTGKGGEGDGRA